MADLITHIAVAHIFKRLSSRPEEPLLFALGTSLPDLLGRAPGLLLLGVAFLIGRDVPLNLTTGLDALHMPVPYMLFCLFSAYCIRLEHRRLLFWNLLIGGYLHFLIDFLQAHMDGGYRILFPFSWASYELAWIDTEASLRVAPLLAVAALVVEWQYRKRKRGVPIPPTQSDLEG